MLDLDYEEDSNAEIDMNVVMNAKGEIVEIQGTGEQVVSFSRDRLNEFLIWPKRASRCCWPPRKMCLHRIAGKRPRGLWRTRFFRGME